LAEKTPVIDPWATKWKFEDYARLFKLFGIEPIEPLLKKYPVLKTSRYMRRGVVFGHRDLKKILDAVHKGKPFAVMSGIKPTGEFHLGSKMTAEEIVFFQHLSPKATASYCIADVEAYADNGIPFSESARIAVGNVADMLALGLDPKRTYIYKQSEEIRVMNLSFIFSRGVTHSTLKAIYGEKSFGHYLSALVQAGDILLPQLKDFNGPKPVVVPVGADQDPHIRLTRDLAQKYQDQFRFVAPSATYHKLMRSLSTGKDKMSKKDPMGYLLLSDDLSLVRKKILNAFTGGRETEELQRKLGGEAYKCPVYDLYLFHFSENDKKVENVYEECIHGKRLCGECKMELLDYAIKSLREHQRKRESVMDLAEEILARKKK